MLAHSSFNDLPTKWSLLLAHTLPPQGGNTESIDTRAVYDDLFDDLEATAEPLQAVHYLWHSRERGGFTNVSQEMMRAMPPVEHPLVRTLPNGRRALYIGAHASHIAGRPIEEGIRLLQRLAEIAAQSKHIYSHEWRYGPERASTDQYPDIRAKSQLTSDDKPRARLPRTGPVRPSRGSCFEHGVPRSASAIRRPLRPK